MTFNSQICTTREQSERLLSLGLKKETADCAIFLNGDNEWEQLSRFLDWEKYADMFPAWSLHRLILLLDTIACDWIFRNGDCYTNAINGIEWLIEEGYFNEEYLNKEE